MICQQVERNLVYYLLGELPPAQRARLEEHIPQCLACSEELKALSRDLGLMREAIATSASAPDSLVAAVRRRVSEERIARPAARGWLSAHVRPAHALGMLMVFAAVAVVTWFISQHRAVAASITHTALMHDRSVFISGDGAKSMNTGTAAEAARTLSRRIDTEVLPVSVACEGMRFRGYAERRIAGYRVALLVYGNDETDECVSVYQYAHSHCALAKCLAQRKYHGKSYVAGSTEGTTIVAWLEGETVIALVSCCPLARALARAEAARESLPKEVAPERSAGAVSSHRGVAYGRA